MKNKMLRICRAAVKDKKGFTLIELMVTVVVIALVLIMVFQFFDFSGSMFRRSDTMATQQDQGRLIVRGLRKDLGTALDVAIVNTIDPDSFSVAAGTYAVYAKNGQLVRKDSAGTITSVHSSYPVNYLAIQFSSTTTSIIHIAVTVQGVVIAETDVNTLNTTVKTDSALGFATSGNLVLFTPSS